MAVGTWATANVGGDFSQRKDGAGGHSKTFSHVRVWGNTNNLDSAQWAAGFIYPMDGPNAPIAKRKVNNAKWRFGLTSATDNEILADLHYIINPPAEWETTDNFFTMSLSTASVLLDRTGMIAGTDMWNEFDITPLIQALVDDPMYTAGDPVALVAIPRTTATRRANIRSADGGQPTQLVIDWVDDVLIPEITLADPTPPAVPGFQHVSGTVNLTWTISPEGSADYVELYLTDDLPIAHTTGTSILWDTTTVPDGRYTLRAAAVNVNGAGLDEVSIVVNNSGWWAGPGRPLTFDYGGIAAAPENPTLEVDDAKLIWNMDPVVGAAGYRLQVRPTGDPPLDPFPEITDDFDSIAVAPGSPGNFTAVATGATSAYAEVKDDLDNWIQAVGATNFDVGTGTLTYTTNNTVTWHNNRQYRAVFVNADGLVTYGQPATLTLTGGGDPGDPGGGFSDLVVWLPTSVDQGVKHVEGAQAGGSSAHWDDVVVGAMPGKPAFPSLSLKFTHHPGDKFPVGGGARAEWRPQPDVQMREGEEAWFGWIFGLPTGTPNPNSWGRIMGQMHGGSGSPTWALRHDPDGSLKADLRGGATNANLRQPVLLPTIQRDHAYKVKLFVKAASNNTGITRIWIDGVQVLNNTGPNKYIGSNGYIKFGIYGSDTGVITYVYMGGFIKSRVESDINLMHSRYSG